MFLSSDVGTAGGPVEEGVKAYINTLILDGSERNFVNTCYTSHPFRSVLNLYKMENAETNTTEAKIAKLDLMRMMTLSH